MRVLIAATLGFALVTGAASAAPWSDPNGRLVFDAPAGWTTSVEQSGEYTYVVTGTANNECHIISRPSPRTATVSAAAVRVAGANDAQFNDAFWQTLANGFGRIFPANSAQVQSHSQDSSQFWPIQRAVIQSPQRSDLTAPIQAGFEMRPGFELMTLCMTYGGPDATQTYDAVMRSVGHPNDATFQADAERLGAQNAAANAAADAQNAQTQEEIDREARRRRVQH
ncbi:hypothetical protein [Terricaulis silvestris]|uniref:Uncharacterized protein n=1 Tax=Terricaulis silvestris TaxID=2686094 RepID=A0A6I6MP58_9CAUL|nr:hypothetical protein [Terricaulis silvestris]QGZ94567.1 hypothetical protein DSM104635_01386 [Terricaulis silvestris]